MKYKIGNEIVEAIQYLPGDKLERITSFCTSNNDNDDLVCEISDIQYFCIKGIKFSSPESFRISFNYPGTTSLKTISSFSLKFGDYLVKSTTSLFKLTEEEFNNMATKIKEPKFKVGDKVYLFAEKENSIEFSSYIVKEIRECGYYSTSGYIISESDSLGLEEAIEKLKEL